MPWVDEEQCSGCAVCVEECPVDAISMQDEIAAIDMDGCIRCGVCHDMCPEDAVRHDGEKIPERIQQNLDMTRRFMDECARLLGDDTERWKCLERMKKHFNKEKRVAEETLAALEKLAAQSPLKGP